MAEKFEIVEQPEGICETCEGTLVSVTGKPITFVKTPIGLICDNCVEDMRRKLQYR